MHICAFLLYNHVLYVYYDHELIWPYYCLWSANISAYTILLVGTFDVNQMILLNILI
jgi:hypothetical protein